MLGLTFRLCAPQNYQSKGRNAGLSYNDVNRCA